MNLMAGKMEKIFTEVVEVCVRCRDCEERKAQLRISVELQKQQSPVHKRDLLVRLTDDVDPCFLYGLHISEEDFQSLKVQQRIRLEFTSFPDMLIEYFNECRSQQKSSHPRFQLLLSCDSASLQGPANFSVVERCSYQDTDRLTLRLKSGSDREVNEYLAASLTSLKLEKQSLEEKLQKTEEDLSRRLKHAQQTLSEKTKELDELHSEWNLQTNLLSSRHSEQLQSEKEKVAEIQSRLDKQKQELSHKLESDRQQFQTRLAELEESCQDLMRMRYKKESTNNELKCKLEVAKQDCLHFKQRVASLEKENHSLHTTLHEKECLANQLQMRVGVLEQQVVRTSEALEATKQQKEYVEEKAESKEHKIQKLEEEVTSLTYDVEKGYQIINKFVDNEKKYRHEARTLVVKLHNMDVALKDLQKILQETQAERKHTEKDLHETQQQLSSKDQQVEELQKQLNENKDLLQTKENVISWLNRQLNEKQIAEMAHLPEPLESASALSSAGLRTQFYPQSSKAASSDLGAVPKHTQSAGLDPKYFRRSDSIPVYGLPASLPPIESPPEWNTAPVPSTYIPSVPKHTQSAGLDPKYFRRSDSIPVYGLPASQLPRESPPERNTAPVPSSYFPS
ncbi:spindle assembly abnormal protein 6 homolog isoform X1 [Nerophis lumbriciformis]|uniref:spindle assembly abnormal protein 6 homolog isoform X1 n=1 Tax=Nerophis lumbriciformis TaxID=546530 RepID=UPI002AE01146|nr:spindle assembly abnormal protein 6 homolog isoform X1 [Nerophis lumbriciformis]